jgi:hypothetical protein
MPLMTPSELERRIVALSGLYADAAVRGQVRLAASYRRLLERARRDWDALRPSHLRSTPHDGRGGRTGASS